VRAPLVIVTFVSVLLSVSILIPYRWMALFPLNVVAPEIAPAIAAISLLGLAVAWRRFRVLTPLLALSAAIALWPCIEYLRTPKPIATERQSLPLRETDVDPPRTRFYRPNDNVIRPAIVDLYGGAWKFGSPANGRSFHRRIASNGYAVFAIAYRHAPRFTHPAQIEDVRAALSSILANASTYRIDPNNLFFCGRSAGGHLALLAAFEPGAPPVRGVIAFYPPTDLLRAYRETPTPDPLGVRNILRDFLGGPPERFPSAYKEASPSTYVRPGLPPTLLIHGSRDHIVKAEFSRALHHQLKSVGNRSTLIELPWAEHGFDGISFGLGNRIAEPALLKFLYEETKNGS
jgi:acetyl esterase/lipase